jgi:hypothetical protein
MNSDNPVTSVTPTQRSDVRAWLRRRKKDHYIGFDDEQRRELRRFFQAIDESGTGSIGYEQLEEPLIALGLAESSAQVQEMFHEVDLDNSGRIEFNEFLQILAKTDGGDIPLAQFFRSLIDGTLMKNSQTIPIKLVISAYRRRMLMDAMMAEGKQKEKGERVMKAYARQLNLHKKTG